jgi:hypothetical protein
MSALYGLCSDKLSERRKDLGTGNMFELNSPSVNALVDADVSAFDTMADMPAASTLVDQILLLIPVACSRRAVHD